jgi:hypothetical protein
MLFAWAEATWQAGVGLREPAGDSPNTRRAPSADDQDEAWREQRPFGAVSAKAARHALAKLSAAARPGACRQWLKRTTCWRNRSPDLDNFSTPCRLAENASAGAAMAGPSLPRPPALLHLGRTGPIGPDRCQYNLLNPRRGIMMRIMQSFHTAPRLVCVMAQSSGPSPASIPCNRFVNLQVIPIDAIKATTEPAPQSPRRDAGWVRSSRCCRRSARGRPRGFP